MWNWDCLFGWVSIACHHWYDFFHETDTPLSNTDFHWTHVAWTIAAVKNNWIWIVWVNPFSKIISLKIWNGSTLSSIDEIRAINFATENNIKVINASLGWDNSSLIEMEAIKRYWDEVWWLFVAAAGNDDVDIDGYEKMVYPCWYELDNIICVGAIDKNNNRVYNYWNKSVDIAAPWCDIYSTISSWNMLNILNQKFDYCSSSGFSWWFCYSTWHFYAFDEEVEYPVLDLTSRDRDWYLESSLGCVWTWDLDITINWISVISGFFEKSLLTWLVIPLDDYISSNSSNFLFKIQLSWGLCYVDNVHVYNDPYTLWEYDLYDWKSWTSMATPHVAWLVSLVWMINSGLNYHEVKDLIMNNWNSLWSLQDKIVSWKSINVKRTLDAAWRKLFVPGWLTSNWNGKISWDSMSGVSSYYYEIFSGESIVKTWKVDSNVVELGFTWDYVWRVSSIDTDWNSSDFSTGYICSKPEYIGSVYLSWYECEYITWVVSYVDNCSSGYTFLWKQDNELSNSWAMLNTSWSILKNVYIQNKLLESVKFADVVYTWLDKKPTLVNYDYNETVNSTTERLVWNIVELMQVLDWACWNSMIAIGNISCDDWAYRLDGKNLYITAPGNKQWTVTCSIGFSDDEWNEISWVFKYSFNTVQQITNNWWWWGWGGWWWGGWWGWWNSSKNETKINSWIINTWNNKNNSWLVNTLTGNDVKIDDRKIELFDDENNEENVEEKRMLDDMYLNSVQLNWFTVEFNNAYEFAHRVWITTIDSIEKANMNWELTRIAMAKMLSQYAINILGKKPDTTKNVVFWDVSKALDSQYNDWVTLAYQLWIMWVWINKFRPNDIVTRAEFWTALSRMLYWIKDWTNNYYSTHLLKLKEEWIINNINPDLKELRWYVMIMLMRSANNK